MSKYRRDGRQFRHRETFLLTRWIDGTRLDRLLPEKLPAARCAELVADLGTAVAHLHATRASAPRPEAAEHGVIVDVDGNTRLRRLQRQPTCSTSPTRTRTGTAPYRPPDRPGERWTTVPDVYALGAILAELLAGPAPALPARMAQRSRAETVPAELRPRRVRRWPIARKSRYPKARIGSPVAN